MRRSLQQESDGLPMALAIHLCLYCAVAACFALAIYYLMQPTRLPNPGMAAHKPSPTTVNYLELLRSERQAATANIRVELEPETTGTSMRPAPKVKPEPKKGKAQTAQSQSRARITVRRLQPAEPMAYAQQPFFGGYRPMLCFVL
jgi:hypothetical protein